jgi:tetratricopeptide (TPR) repeat protein
VHYFDPHLPYRSPLQRLTRFGSRPYDAEIAYVDAEFGRLLDRLDELGERDRTLIVVAGDHGEALGDHGEPTHGMLIYESTVRVPLIFSCASLFDGAYRVDDMVVGLTDILPTVEELLGIENGRPVDGQSLLREVDADRAIYVETEMPLSVAGWSPLRGLRTHVHKFILAPEREFYDLALDPAETRNAYAAGGPAVATLESRLSAVLATAGAGAERDLSDEEIERLGSLGYVQAGAGGAEGTLPDPKAMMSVYGDGVRAEQLYGQGRYAEAADLAGSVLDRSRDYRQAVRVLAFSYVKLGRVEEAIGLLRDSTRDSPDVFLVRSLAQVLIIDERYDDALDVLRVYASIDPLDGRVPLLRGDIQARRGRNDRARAHFEEAIELDEHRVGRTARERIARLDAPAP